MRATRLPFALGRILIDGFIGRSFVRAFHGSSLRRNSLLVLRLDGIGDYVLFRNFLKSLRESPRFGAHRITLCGNSMWKELAERVDSAHVDGFVWVDTRRFQRSVSYRYRTLTRLLEVGAETILQPTHSRGPALEDAIVAFLSAPEKIGSQGDTHNITAARKAASDRFYTRLIEPDESLTFEFDKNRSFFERLLETDLSGVRPEIERGSLGESSARYDPYAILFPGAGEERRRWSGSNFGKVLDFILSSSDLNVLVCGSAADRDIARRIVEGRDAGRVFDLAGRTTLFDLATLIADARLLVSNETGAVHIAAATRTRAICLSNGNHFGRFTEYPASITTRVTTIYPPAVERGRGDPAALHAKYYFGSFEEIDEITVDRVIEKIGELAGERMTRLS